MEQSCSSARPPFHYETDQWRLTHICGKIQGHAVVYKIDTTSRKVAESIPDEVVEFFQFT
jgi:hypothetical protein